MFGLCEPPYTNLHACHDTLVAALTAASHLAPAALVIVLRPSAGMPLPPPFETLDALVLILPTPGEGAPLRALPEGLWPAATAHHPAPDTSFSGRLLAQARHWYHQVLAGIWGRSAQARLLAMPPEARREDLLAFACDAALAGAVRAQALLRAARAWRTGDARNAARAALYAHALVPSPRHALLAAFRAFDAGELTAPAVLLAREVTPSALPLTPSEARRSREIAALAHLKIELPAPALPRKGAGPRLYVAASAQPYHVSGYTQRTQAVLRAMQGAGVPLAVATRPGYPLDRADRLPAPLENENTVEGIRYHHILTPEQPLPLDAYLPVAAAGIAALAQRLDARRIWAASNHVNALPALIAARQLGLPFTYELRGLWEYSRASKLPGFAGSDRFNLGLALEAEVARGADKLVVISDQLARHARDVWGVPQARIALLPNCVAGAEVSQATPRPLSARPVIGYLGSLVPYEGLGTLVEAAALLKAQGVSFEIRIIGEGESRAGLIADVARLGLADVVSLPGRIPPAEARTALDTFDIVAIPRLPYKVCKMVPPLKLVEALAAGKPVLLPDLPVFRDEAGAAALYFTSGDAVSLAQALASALADEAGLIRLSEKSLAQVRATRTWERFSAVLRDD